MLRATIREAVGEGNCEVVAIDVRCRRTSKLQVYGRAGRRQGRYCQTNNQHHWTDPWTRLRQKNLHNALTPDDLAGFTWLCDRSKIRTDRRTYHPDYRWAARAPPTGPDSRSCSSFDGVEPLDIAPRI